MKTKKLLSILLALMMMLSVVPFYASAATQIALKATHVTEWPTAEGEIYYGEPLSKINLVGGKVVYEGVEVPGHFEHVDPAATAEEAMEGYEADIKFVPDDTATYKGFTKYYSKTTFTVHKATPVLADESKPPVVNGTVDAGVTLSTITISDGAMVNPYDADETYAKKATWKWSNPNTVVSESGYYEAKFVAGSIRYVTVTRNLWVEVYKEIPLSVISELPIIETFNYNPSITWADVEIKGGKAVIENDDGTTTEINGVFSFSNEHLLNTVPSVGTFELDIVFTPENSEEALPCNFRIPVTVNKGQMKFVDENGNEIVPEITVDYGTKFSDISRLLRPYVKGPEYVYFAMGDLSSQLCANGTYTVTATAPSDGAHYEDTELTFKIVVEPKVINPKAYSSTEGYYVYDNSGVYHVEGTFDVYVNDELIASDVAYNSGKVKWEATENGTYTMKWAYNPVENDNFIINDVTTTMNVILPNTITYSGIRAYILGDNGKSELSETTERKQGSSVTIGCDAPAFAAWVITDAKGNAVDLGIEDLTATEITFVMPDYDIVITTKTELEIAAENCDHICHSDNPLFQMLWKVLTFIFRLFDVQQYCDCGNLHYDAPLFG